MLDGTLVLVVDDDPDNAAVLGYLVSDAGATVRTAPCAHDALQLLAEWRPHVLLLDISMPEMDGVDLLAAIRRLPEHREIPAVAVSALASTPDKERAFDAGFNAYMTKPYDADALVELVEWLASPDGRRASALKRASSSVSLP